MGMGQYHEIQAARTEREWIMIVCLIRIAALEHTAVHKEAACIGLNMEAGAGNRFCRAQEGYFHQ
jgi:hypothetical protein